MVAVRQIDYHSLIGEILREDDEKHNRDNRISTPDDGIDENESKSS